jgi:hypothetical protein
MGYYSDMGKEWEEVLTKVEDVIGKMNKYGSDFVFFRGHSDSSWTLTPSLYREPISTARIEQILYYNFVSHSSTLFPKQLSPWEFLFEMRHCGIPTRLLDWTETFSTALYFALKSNKPNPCVWILNPYDLNKQSYDNETVLNTLTDLEFDYFEGFIAERKPTNKTPIAILPITQSMRVFAQKSVFTLHGTKTGSIEKLFPNCVIKVDIPPGAIQGARSFLSLSGVNEYSLFPDPDGLGRYLVERHCK